MFWKRSSSKASLAATADGAKSRPSAKNVAPPTRTTSRGNAFAAATIITPLRPYGDRRDSNLSMHQLTQQLLIVCCVEGTDADYNFYFHRRRKKKVTRGEEWSCTRPIVLGRISGFGYETRTGPAIRRSPVSIQRMAPRLAVGYGFEISRKMGCRPSKSLEFSEMDAVSVAGRYVRARSKAAAQSTCSEPSGWRA